jgi:hypothetical protein
MAAMLLFYILFYHWSFQDFKLSGFCVTTASQVCAATMLLLWIVENKNL